MLKKVIVDLYFDLFEKGIIPRIYSSISYSQTKNVMSYSGHLEKNDLPKSNTVFMVKYVPKYLTPNLKDHFKAINFFETKGYAVNLNETPHIDEYLKIHVKPRLRSALRSNIKRLESCFKINYHVFCGEITVKEYDFLLDVLRILIERRFKQRNEVNKRLSDWNHFHLLFFKLINEKRASLFVIYDGENPIAISLNYHFDKIFFNAIPSYDIDYAKFGLGHIIIYKQLEWCIKNKIEIFDMSMGNPNYKIKWCNMEYDFEHHIVYRPASFRASFFAKIIAFRISIKNYLKSKNVHLLYGKIKAGLKREVKITKELNHTFSRLNYTIEPEEELQFHDNLKKVDFNRVPYSFLKQSVCDFIYTTSEHISNISIMEIEKDKSYLVKGNDNTHKITFYDN